MRSHLTIRNLPPDVASELEEERKRRGTSLNRTVVSLLRRALGLAAEVPYDNGLGRHAGSWAAEQLAEFEATQDGFEKIDGEPWR